MGKGKIALCRAVLDCNIVISAILFKGRISVLVESWKSGAFQLLVCAEMIEEWARVLTYPKFQLSDEDIHHIIEKEILPYVEPVRIGEIPDAIKDDPQDNIYLACAEQGKANFLVSGDTHLLKLRNFRNIPIVTAAEFLKLLDRKGGWSVTQPTATTISR